MKQVSIRQKAAHFPVSGNTGKHGFYKVSIIPQLAVHYAYDKNQCPLEILTSI